MDDYQEELLERDAFDQDVTDVDDATELYASPLARRCARR